MDVKQIPKEETYPWLLQKHYAKRIPSICYAYGLYQCNVLVGVCTYGHPASDGLYDICGDEYRDCVLELNRLVKEDNLPKNTQSYFVAQTFKLLPQPMIIISYSDPNNGHCGYTYQALNFLFIGYGGDDVECYYKNKPIHTRHIKKHEFFQQRNLPFDDTKTTRENFKEAGGVIKERTAKHRYVYFIGNKQQKKNMKNNLKYQPLPYPKLQNTNYDTSTQLTKQFDLGL